MRDFRPVAVIDDDDDTRCAMEALLRSLGFDARSYASAEACLADAAVHWGCIISDIRMPEVDGFELLSAIQLRSAGTPVILMTAHSVPAGARQRAFRAGASWFFEKPVDADILLDRLVNIIGR